MTLPLPTADDVAKLAGTRHPVVGFEYPPEGLQPYYTWLLGTLQRLADCAAGALKVDADDASATTVRIAPGRAALAGAAATLADTALDLAAHDGDTALVFLYANQGAGAVGAAGSAAGWPATPHLKLAEVTLANGAITAILDRRGEALFAAHALSEWGLSATAGEINRLCAGIGTGVDAAALNGVFAAGVLAGTTGATWTVRLGAAGARLQLDTNGATGNFTLRLAPAALTADRRWTFPDGSDTVVGLACAQTLSNKTLAAPVIADLSQARHDHGSVAAGGALAAASASAAGVVLRAAAISAPGALGDNSGGSSGAAIGSIDASVPAPQTSPGSAEDLRDDLAQNVLPAIGGSQSALRDAVATLASAHNSLAGTVAALLQGLRNAGVVSSD